jgi:hypothetical protein
MTEAATDRSELSRRSERLLKETLLNVYKQDLDNFQMSRHTLETLFSKYRTGFEALNMNREALVSRFAEGIVMRPICSGKHANVLGRIHESVMLMCENDHPEFSAYAVCMARVVRDEPMVSQVHSAPDGGRVILLSFDLFNTLYTINQLYYMAGTSNSASRERIPEYLTNMFCIYSQSFGQRTLTPSLPFVEPRDKCDLEVSHYLANCQQQFVLLHEFGHIAASNGQKEPSLSDEFVADEWAAKKIRTHRNRFYDAFVQMRSILWLFELMHFSEVIEKKRSGDALTARRRFDSLRPVADPKREVLPDKEVLEVRMIVDGMAVNWASHYSSLKGNVS